MLNNSCVFLRKPNQKSNIRGLEDSRNEWDEDFKPVG